MDVDRVRSAVKRAVALEKGTGDALLESGNTGLIGLGLLVLLESEMGNVEQMFVGAFLVLVGVVLYVVRRHYRDCVRDNKE